MKHLLQQLGEMFFLACAAVGAGYLVLTEWQKKPRLAFSGVLFAPAVGWALLRVSWFPADLVPVAVLLAAITAPTTLLWLHGRTLREALEDVLNATKRRRKDDDSTS